METEELNIDIDPELLAEFCDESQEELASLDSLFVSLGENPSCVETITAIFRPMHTIKGNSAFFGLMKVKKLAHELETLLSQAKEGKLTADDNVINILLRGTDMLRQMLDRASRSEPELTAPEAFDELIAAIEAAKSADSGSQLWQKVSAAVEDIQDRINDLDNEFAQKLIKLFDSLNQIQKGSGDKKDKPKKNHSDNNTVSDTQPNDENQPDQPPGDQQEKNKTETRKTMRISEDAIDKFLGYVGELVVVGQMYSHLQKDISDSNRRHAVAKDFRTVNETFNDLSENLQKSIMEIRKVPVKGLLQKVPRMVRDIASAAGKDIQVKLQGQDIQVDKSIMEALDGPLTHMARNAADHGIETVEERKAAGKNTKGTITVSVTETSDDISLSIIDDGKGLNFDALREKAVKLAMIEPDQELTRRQVTDLIFMSGLSTAQKVTDVSGRGVGMDVVRQNIENANGKIIVESEQSKGSKFTIKLPKSVSTQITDGLLIELAGGCYVIPLDKVLETFHVPAQSIKTVKEKGKCVMNHASLLPVVELSGRFGLSSQNEKQEFTLVAIESRGKTVAVEVDNVIGTQRVVLKTVQGINFSSNLFKAASIMGDGKVAMVLDVDNICCDN